MGAKTVRLESADRRGTWFYWLELTRTGRRIKRDGGWVGGAWAPRRVLDRWSFLPSATKHTRTHPSEASARAALREHIAELLAEGFVQVDVEEGRAGARAFAARLERAAVAKQAAAERRREAESKRPLPVALRPWKRWWDGLSPRWKRALRDALRIEDEPTVSDLEQLPALEDLQLDVVDIGSDLTPLAKLTQLETLDLSGTAIRDLAPLAKLKRLRSLYLTGCSRVVSVRPLLGLRRLATLDLSESGVEELRPLAKMRSLSHLVVSQRPDTDVEHLSELLGCRVTEAT